MQATIFRYLSYAGLILGIVLSLWVLRWGAVCFLFSIACAHLSSTARSEAHSGNIHETLFVVLSLLGQINKKIDADSAKADPPEPVSRPTPRLREYRE